MENPTIEPMGQSANPLPTPPPSPTPTPSQMGATGPSKKSFNLNTLLIILAVVAVLIMGVFVYGSITKTDVLSWVNIGLPTSKDAVAKKALDYLNNNVLQEGQGAELGEVSEQNGVVKMQIKIGGSTYDSYATKDGKLFFPEAFTIDAK